MKRNIAIELAAKYIREENRKQPVSIDTMNVLDEDPENLGRYWCFKNYYEDLNPMRGGGKKLSSVRPFYVINKESSEITELTWKEFDELKN